MAESASSQVSVASQVLFKGVYDFGYDEKRRVQVPYKWRPGPSAQSEYTFALYFSVEEQQQLPCVTVMTQERFLAMVERLNQLKMFDPRVEAFKRDLGSNSDDAVLDKAGRICIPERLGQRANFVIDGKVVLVGVVDRFQIWNPEYYERVRHSDRVAASELKREI